MEVQSLSQCLVQLTRTTLRAVWFGLSVRSGPPELGELGLVVVQYQVNFRTEGQVDTMACFLLFYKQSHLGKQGYK